MSKFSADFYHRLGVTPWRMRTGFAERLPLANVEQTLASTEVSQQAVLPPPEVSVVVLQNEAACVEIEKPVVLLGLGLQSFWQDERAIEWHLWLNIMQACGWQEEQVLFVDSALLSSEEQAFASVEEIIAMGVERLLSMDLEHPINEMLSEGVEIVPVPSFEALLSDPYAKKTFYQQALKLHA